MEKRKYYINMEAQLINEVPVPNGYQFEVYATESEITEIDNRFTKLNETSTNAVKYLGKPFDEWDVDDKRETYDDELMSLYGMIYHLGSKETKEDMVESGIVSFLKFK